jgi:hypothetical protein
LQNLAASLKIYGSVRGNFSPHSEGFIRVREFIKDKKIQAQRIEADLITIQCGEAELTLHENDIRGAATWATIMRRLKF